MKKHLRSIISILLLICFFSKSSSYALILSWEKLGFVIEKAQISTESGEKKDVKEENFKAILSFHYSDEEDFADDFLNQNAEVCLKLPKSFHQTLEKPPKMI